MKRIVISMSILVILAMGGCAQNSAAVSKADPVEEVPVPETVAEAEPEIAVPAAPESGPYTATSMGFHGIVTVTLDVADGKLTSVIAKGDDETVGLGTLALDLIPEEMLKANSIEVDSVTSATHTSLAVLEAAKKALAQAGLTNDDLQR